MLTAHDSHLLFTIITQLISELCFPKSYFNDCYVFLFNWTSGAPLCVCKGGVCNPESSSISMPRANPQLIGPKAFVPDTDETKFFETDTRLRLWVAFIRDRVRDRDSEYALYESETETETLYSRETRD